MIEYNDYPNPYNVFKIDEIRRCMNDPVYFLENYLRTESPVNGIGGFERRPRQADFINMCTTNRFTVADMPRQSGKTIMAAGIILWRSIFRADQKILVGGHNYASAKEIVHHILLACEYLPPFIRPNILQCDKGGIVFDNGSRIISRAITGSAARGLSLSLVYLDEFAFVRPTDAREFWHSMAPTLSTGGDCIIASSYNTSTDMFAEILKGADNIQSSGFINHFKSFRY